MIHLANWFSDIQHCVAALGRDSVLGVKEPADPAMSRTIALSGFPSVLPLWSGRRHIIGLLADPELAPESWAALILQDNEAMTLASDASTLLPQLILTNIVLKSPAAARRLAEQWTDIGPKAIALHLALGGTEETLSNVAAVMNDVAVVDSVQFKGQVADAEAARSEVFRRIDQSEAFTRYADWLDKCIRHEWPQPGDSSDFGSWRRRVICWTHVMSISWPEMPKPPHAWLRSVIEGSAGIDTGMPVEASWSVHPGAGSAGTVLLEAAESIARMGTANDPISAGIVRALLDEGATYSGIAHAEAIVALDQGGEPERAWAAMQSAAWWAARNAAEMSETILGGARFLAERHGWHDLVWTIDRTGAAARPT